ncbi:DNA-binding transcriptional regulator YciT [Photobacterium rosenbergii]|uniref:DNA-binding transcriptional regulator YciT n=1 Tax=Photobacterium rosenbergii TaxID=294936 RepID=A0ABU3ZEK4_9GAMM|nr:DNA-binding transcriptional regulator YciT [Photobacterium rosenbergii]MDV5168458.1 DNA-binding transcriptional regulator YciT [Photobacterium rosenbergii]
MNPRHSEILQLVNQNRRVLVAELASHTGVSEVTIRQDLTQLEKQGYLKRVHGGATALQSDDMNDRLNVRFDIKQQLAQRAAELVQPGETVMIEGGSANALLARELANRGDVTIITPSAYIAGMIRQSKCDVILLGGIYQPQGESLVGPLTRLCIEHTHFSTAFLGIDGFHPDTGFTSRDMMRADVANAILNKNQRNIVLTDASKFGQIFSTSIGRLDQFSVLVTNSGVDESDLALLRKHHVAVELVDN